MVCEGKRKITMSGVNAINSSNVSFSGKKNAEETKQTSKAKQTFTSKVANKLAQPVKDSFHKKYGEDAKATPKLVGDYIVDTALKVAVPVATAVVLFTKMRKNTNGLTEAVKQNIKEVSGETLSGKEKISKVVKESLAQVRKNNAIKAGEALADATGEQAKTGLFSRIATKLKEAASVKSPDGKFDPNKAIDVAISGAVTAGATSGALEVTDAVVTGDDAELAGDAALKIKINNPKMKDAVDQAGTVLNILAKLDGVA